MRTKKIKIKTSNKFKEQEQRHSFVSPLVSGMTKSRKVEPSVTGENRGGGEGGARYWGRMRRGREGMNTPPVLTNAKE